MVEIKRNLLILSVLILLQFCCARFGKIKDKTKCPSVKPLRNFDIKQMLNQWYVIEYYASSEEAISYRCMRVDFTKSNLPSDITMNFTYMFTDDPFNEKLIGNITWTIPDLSQPAHWVHSEDTYEGVYNTYVLDTDHSSWALLLHCAEKSKVPRYLSSFIMSREPDLGVNVISYLRDKIAKYDVDVQYMFEMVQDNCNADIGEDPYTSVLIDKIYAPIRKNPMKHDEYTVD